MVRTFNLCSLSPANFQQLPENDSCGWSFLAIRHVSVLDRVNRRPRSLNGMKSILAQFLSIQPRHSARLLPRMFAAVLCVFFSTAVPALADTVRFNQVVQTHSSSKGPLDLRLNTLVSQDPSGSGTKVSTQQNGPRNESASTQTPGGPKTEALLSNVVVTSQGQDIGIDITEEGEVEGTICDCGEILIAGADFPKWPFLFLGAVPFVFISDCDTCDEPPSSQPTPTPPPPTPTPEPASLLLFGSGLLAAGAGLRRRYGKAKLAAQTKPQEEE